MHGLRIQFAYPWSPWLFLLIIPALAITLILYFRINKRFRRTRNRVISIVLHMLVMTLCICVLTGMTFVYEVDNSENEIILLVDVSDTEEQSKEARDRFVEDVLKESGYDGFKVGLVTFGFDQVYAAPLTYETDGIYGDYINSVLPDTSATDIAAALRYTRTLFTNPETSKIVLITDGKETDERAENAIRSVAAQGTKVDIAYIPSEYDDSLMVTGVVFPDYHVKVNQPCTIGVAIDSKISQAVLIEIADNGEAVKADASELNVGEQTVYFDGITFAEEGLHEISVTVRSQDDNLAKNNSYSSYYYLEVFNNVLILERFDGQSQKIESLLKAGDENRSYTVETRNIMGGDLPKSVEELRVYDQIILNNIANEDMPTGFDEMLYSYVYDYGGGLFTAGGNEEQLVEGKQVPHAYNREDMKDTLYQQMLPVQAINYTPPVGVMVIIDISGSMEMEESTGLSRKGWAVQGAIECLNALTERDYLGVMTLDTTYGKVLDLTRCIYQTEIREKIQEVNDLKGGATNYREALDRAGQALVTLKQVERRHIILITDGQPGESDTEYLPIVKNYYDNNEITVSTIGISMREGDTASQVLTAIAEEGHGTPHILTETQKLVTEMKEDLNMDAIKEYTAEPFNPRVANERSPLFDGITVGTDEDLKDLDVKLGGFYGVRMRQDADLILSGNYDYDVPLYAQWKFGKGMVGSFMSDLNGNWSGDFLQSQIGKTFIMNAVDNLMPTESIRPKQFAVSINEDNYLNSLSIYANPAQGESVRGRIERVNDDFTLSLNQISDDGGVYVTSPISADSNFSRCSFVVKESGVYRIIIEKVNASGEVQQTVTLYKSFAYSKEYGKEDILEDDKINSLSSLAKAGGGTLIADNEDPYEIFENFDTDITHVFDPRWLFIIIALCLFLLDIAVRKFKFKWIHELVRERKEKKAMDKGDEK